MSVLSQLVGGGQPVGSILLAPCGLADTAWLPCDGRTLLRSAYPLLSAINTVPTFTPTQRTKGAASSSAALAVHNGLWVMSGATGANNIQTTPDGVTYTQRATSGGGSPDIRSLISDGTNVVGVGTSQSTFDAWRSSDGLTYTQTVSSVSCQGSSQQCVMARAPTLGTVGRFLVASNTQFFSSDDRGATWTAQAHGLGGNACAVAWTGTRSIALTGTANTLYVSATGLAGSWTTQLTMPALAGCSAGSGAIFSDGAGRVLIVNSFTVLTSQNHGLSWSARRFVQPFEGAAGQIFFGEPSFTNGLFFLPTQNEGIVLVSRDLITWMALPDVNTLRFGGAPFQAISFKAGVYFGQYIGIASALTLAEDATRMYLPMTGQTVPSNSVLGAMPTTTYIKVS